MISLNRADIETLIDLNQAAGAIEEAFRATSLGQINLPPVGHITFPDQGADCHIKYGHATGAPTFVIKVATGFPNNADKGLGTGNGLVLVMSAESGSVEALLQDEMVLTDIRTGIAGAIATRLLARNDSKRILIVGTGPQAGWQIKAHSALSTKPISFEIWGRNADKARNVVSSLASTSDVTLAEDLEQAVRRADVIVTATGATTPLIHSDWVSPGTHITAVGADAPGKQELDAALVARADVLAVDLSSQCLDHGEICHAANMDTIKPEDLREIGALLLGRATGRTAPSQVTIADLTGIAAQDIAMASFVLSEHQKLGR